MEENIEKNKQYNQDRLIKQNIKNKHNELIEKKIIKNISKIG
jgi:hypothetical protein